MGLDAWWCAVRTQPEVSAGEAEKRNERSFVAPHVIYPHRIGESKVVSETDLLIPCVS